MDLDELLYERIWRYLKGKRRQALAADSRRVTLESLHARLTLMARAFTGHPIEIFPAEREGGYKNLSFFLPTECNIFESIEINTLFYFYRIGYLSVQAQLGLNGTIRVPLSPEFQPGQMALDTAPQVLNALRDTYPLIAELHDSLKEALESQFPGKTPDVSWLYGKWMIDDPQKTIIASLEDHGETHMTPPDKPRNSRTIKAVEEIRRVIADKKQQEDFVMTHNFEKVETAEEFDGGWRDFDGEDELEKHQEAVDELNMRFTVRTHDPAHSVLQAEFMENVTAPESANQENTASSIAYPEWDYRQQAYRQHFCKVFPTAALTKLPGFGADTLANHQSILMGMRKLLSQLRNQYEQQRRQTDGGDFDLDAVTEAYADLHANRTPTERLYLASRRSHSELAITLLLDTSLSSDGYVAGIRIIEIEKKAALLFGEILHEFNISFSIATFHSQTRNHLTYNAVKKFDSAWISARDTLGGIEPSGYTRMGGALRHAGNELAQQDAQNKWVLFISDGKPNDFDRYEGQYGIQDVKQAIRELKMAHVNCYALAIEDKARYYLPLMFGNGYYQIVTGMPDLLRAMVLCLEKIKRAT